MKLLLNNLIPATYELYEKEISKLSFRNKRRALELMGEDLPGMEKSLYEMYRKELLIILLND